MNVSHFGSSGWVVIIPSMGNGDRIFVCKGISSTISTLRSTHFDDTTQTIFLILLVVMRVFKPDIALFVGTVAKRLKGPSVKSISVVHRPVSLCEKVTACVSYRSTFVLSSTNPTFACCCWSRYRRPAFTYASSTAAGGSFSTSGWT